MSMKPVLTIATTPKPFRGHIEIIQRNAIRSWSLLAPTVEVLLIGNEPNLASTAKELGVGHVDAALRNDRGIKLVPEMFQQAVRHATAEIVCYINADMLLMRDFIDAVQLVKDSFERFLMVGQRWDLCIDKLIDFNKGWDEDIRERACEFGALFLPGIDYFVFPKLLWGQIPPFVLGRGHWDHWPLYEARIRRAAVIDASEAVFAVHQLHDYSHHREGKVGVYEGQEAKRNLELLGGARNIFTVRETTHVISLGQIVRRCRSCYPVCSCEVSDSR